VDAVTASQGRLQFILATKWPFPSPLTGSESRLRTSIGTSGDVTSTGSLRTLSPSCRQPTLPSDVQLTNWMHWYLATPGSPSLCGADFNSWALWRGRLFGRKMAKAVGHCSRHDAVFVARQLSYSTS